MEAMTEDCYEECRQDDVFDEDSDGVDSIAHLEVMDYEAGENYQISIYPGREVRVGRDDGCNYTISDSRVSKQHFRIYSIIYEEGQTEFPPLVYCEDLESSNGTYVNDALIGIMCRERRGFLLNDGDIIEIRPSWKFHFHQPIHEATYRDVTELEDLGVFRDRFTIFDRILGKGTYGAVYLAQEKATLMQMACKIVNLSACGEKYMGRRVSTKAGSLFLDQCRRASKGRKLAMREIKILSQLSHPHIINLKKAFCTPASLYMITELAPGGDLFSYLESYGGRLDDWHARVISRQVALAIEHLHSKRIAHRDIKPENVLITQTDFGGRVILTDFGFANFADIKTGRLESLLGTSGFVAPEVESEELRKQGYTLAVDLWALGVLTACLLTGASLIPRRELSQLSQLEIANRFLGIGDHYTRLQWANMAPRAQRFLRKLLTTDPAKRMTATEALGHSWFKKPCSEGNLLEERYHKIIRFWKKREGEEEVIEYIRNTSLQTEREKQGPKLRAKLPDTSLSPYFNLDRHLFRRPAPTRKVLLASLAESGSSFVVPDDSQTKPIANESARRRRGISIISVSAKDLFGKSHETQTANLADADDEVVLVPSEPLPRIESLDLRRPFKSLVSEPEVREEDGDAGDENRENKRARTESWDPDDRRIDDMIAKELPRYTSAKVFRDTMQSRREADRKENIRPSYAL